MYLHIYLIIKEMECLNYMYGIINTYIVVGLYNKCYYSKSLVYLFLIQLPPKINPTLLHVHVHIHTFSFLNVCAILLQFS